MPRWHTCGANLRNVYDRLKGRPTPGFCRPRTLALRAHNAASFAIITSLLSPPRGSNEVPSSLFIVRSSPRSFLPLCISCFFFAIFRARPRASARDEYNVLITKYRPAKRLSIFSRQNVSLLFTRIPLDMAKEIPGELIAFRQQSTSVFTIRFYLWILLGNIYVHIRCINYKRRVRNAHAREDWTSPSDTRS